MNHARASRGVLTTVAILALVIGAGATLSLLGCGSGGGSSDLVGPAEDVVLFPGGADVAKADTQAGEKVDTNRKGINLGTSGHFYHLACPKGFVDNHWFITKAGVAYQVEVIGDGDNQDVDLYIGRSFHPFTNGVTWKSSVRGYPLMDGIVFKSARDGLMYVDGTGRWFGRNARKHHLPHSRAEMSIWHFQPVAHFRSHLMHAGTTSPLREHHRGGVRHAQAPRRPADGAALCGDWR